MKILGTRANNLEIMEKLTFEDYLDYFRESAVLIETNPQRDYITGMNLNGSKLLHIWGRVSRVRAGGGGGGGEGGAEAAKRALLESEKCLLSLSV